MLQAYVTSAGISDKEGCKQLLRSKRLRRIKKLWVDAGYRGEELREIAKQKGKDLEVVKREASKIRVYNDEWRAEWVETGHGFRVLPRRWVVERTFAWIGKYRRMSKDYEYCPKTSEAMIFLCMTRTMVNRRNSIG